MTNGNLWKLGMETQLLVIICPYLVFGPACVKNHKKEVGLKLGELKPLVSLNEISMSIIWIVYGFRDMGNIAEAGEHKHDIIYWAQPTQCMGYNVKHQVFFFLSSFFEFFISAIVGGLPLWVERWLLVDLKWFFHLIFHSCIFIAFIYWFAKPLKKSVLCSWKQLGLVRLKFFLSLHNGWFGVWLQLLQGL